ncbi:endonuclease [Flavobacterium sp.]|uniref:endonuclease n=1 Tax=Flavobacterium sp. TaxID=239 RepID=UPI0025BBCEAB|nr:endonuclease [Flavobacterium sp.]
MKKIYAMAALALHFFAFAQDGAPAQPYYGSFNFTSQSGMTLKNALATLVTNKHTNNLTYSQVWDALKNTDLDPSNSNNVLLVYGWENGSDSNLTNDRSRNKNSNGGNNGEWNREHTYAQALGNPDLGQTGPGADAHHLRASDVQRNNTRGNLKYAAGSGVASGASNGGWYPGDEWKGDVARMMMYMYLRYGDQCLPTVIGIGNSVQSDQDMIDLFLQWNADDPVSPYEDNRNTYLGSTTNTYRQGNRNPFIDNPYLATLIWGGPVAQNRWPSLGTADFAWVSTVTVYPNPAHDRINISSDRDLQDIEVISVNGQVVRHIDHPTFSNQEFTIENLPNGFYLIKLSTGEQSIVKKVIVN